MAKLLDSIHDEMYEKAKKARDENLHEIDNWDDFMSFLNQKKICLAKWCDTVECESKIKDQSKEESIKYMEEHNEEEAILTGSAKTLCIPY